MFPRLLISDLLLIYINISIFSYGSSHSPHRAIICSILGIVESGFLPGRFELQKGKKRNRHFLRVINEEKGWGQKNNVQWMFSHGVFEL